jgi:hypothetical protein
MIFNRRNGLPNQFTVNIAAATIAGSFVVPAGYMIQDVIIVNSTANAITGGLKFGTSGGAADVIAAQAVAGNAILNVADTALLKRFFSATANQTISYDAVTAWNSANVRIAVVLAQV